MADPRYTVNFPKRKPSFIEALLSEGGAAAKRYGQTRERQRFEDRDTAEQKRGEDRETVMAIRSFAEYLPAEKRKRYLDALNQYPRVRELQSAWPEFYPTMDTVAGQSLEDKTRVKKELIDYRTERKAGQPSTSNPHLATAIKMARQEDNWPILNKQERMELIRENVAMLEEVGQGGQMPLQTEKPAVPVTAVPSGWSWGKNSKRSRVRAFLKSGLEEGEEPTEEDINWMLKNYPDERMWRWAK